MVPTMEQLKAISKVTKWTAAITANANSIIVGLERYGSHPDIQLDLPHRVAHYIAQLAHESGGFRYDKEIWGNTPAQQRYDTRTDLGNTPEKDGDGKLYAGRAGIQLTGKANYQAFTKWVRANIDKGAPDFVKEPDLINTDPWEGLVPIWYWTVGNPTGKSLNIYADQNDLEMITRKVNGGTNGLGDRQDYYTRTGLVLLGYDITDEEKAITKFQNASGLETDGISGPRTRTEIHKSLAFKASKQIKDSPDVVVTAAPVTEVKEVAVAPKEVEKPAPDIGKVIGAVAASGATQYVEPALGTFGGLTPWIQGLLIVVALGLVIWFIWGRNLMAAKAKDAKAEIKEKANAGLPS